MSARGAAVDVRPRPLLRALIAEARRRARWRRLAYCGALGLVVAAAAVGVARHGAPAREAPAALPARVAPAFHNGALTLMDVPAEGQPGWYGISSLGADGRLHTLVRCPRRVRWCGEIESIDWSRDGRRLAFGVTSLALDNPYNGLHVVDFRTGHDTQLTTRGTDRAYDWYDLDWAPGGTRLAYVASGGIWIVGADGRGRHRLPTGGLAARSPSWSPDGRWIAYDAGERGSSSIYVSRLDGSGRRLLVGHGSAPAWSPDGTRIAFRRGGGIEFVSPRGRLLASRPPFRADHEIGINGPPVWSPDGTKIAMSNRRYGTYVMNADGTHLRRVTQHTVGVAIGMPNRPAWRPRS